MGLRGCDKYCERLHVYIKLTFGMLVIILVKSDRNKL